MSGRDTTFIAEQLKCGKDGFVGVGINNAFDEIDQRVFVVVEKGAEPCPARLKHDRIHVWTDVKVLGNLFLALLRK